MKFKIGILASLLLLALALGPVPAWAQEPPRKAAPPGDRVTPSDVDRAKRLFQQGEDMPLPQQRQEKFGVAKPQLERIIATEEYRDDPELLFMLGRCWLDGPQSNPKDAREFFNKVVERDQSFAEAYFHLARTWMKPPDQDVSQAKNYLEEAMGMGFDVLGRIKSTVEFAANLQIDSPDFTKKLLEAQTRFLFENLDRTDPFYVPRERVEELEGDDGAKTWNRQRQEAFVRKMEELWEDASKLIDSTDPNEVEVGLEKYQELVEQMKNFAERITHPEFRFRLDEVERQMEEKKRIIKLKILERFAKQGQALLASMKLALTQKNFDEVIRLQEEELVPLTETMVATDDEFRNMADEILVKGQKFHEEALVGKEIQALKLEVLGIVIADEVEEVDEEGKPTGKHKRITIILNQTEAWTGEEEEPPPDWEPKQRKYFIGDAVVQIDELKIQDIQRNKVVCLYKDRYEIDLDLKRIEEEPEAEE